MRCLSVLAVVMLCGQAAVGQAVADSEGGRVVVTVNGTPIHERQVLDEADNRINARKVHDAARGLEFEESARTVVREAMRDEVVHALIERVLIAEQLQADGIQITDAEVDARFAAKAKAAGQTFEEALAEIKEQGRELEHIKERMRWNELGVEKLYAAHDRDQSVLSEEEAEKIYREYPAEFDRPERRRVSHILIRADSEDSGETKKAARQKAEALLKRIRAGESFADVAKEHSEDTATKARGGDRGWSPRGIILTPNDDPFGNAAFALKSIGEMSDVVESRDGYHIIQLTGLEKARRLPFSEVKEQLIDDFRHREIGSFWEEFGENLRKQARVEYSRDELARQKERSRRQQEFNLEMEKRIAAEKARQEEENAAASVSAPSTPPLR
jgi:peptidyl-prolyl cis-trans isomerase C